MNKYKLRQMLEKALYFFVDNASKQELKEQMEWYNASDKEELIDFMFESYLENYYNESELIERINDLFLLDNFNEEEKAKIYTDFLNKNNNSELFELRIGVIE